jgi:uncharacterized protein YndB with AHSA1/START domain
MVYVIVLLIVAVVGLLAVASRKPATFRLARATVIAAPPERIFPLLDDFHEWTKWSPWEHRDPNMTRTYTGAIRDVGAKYAWAGNRKAGSGSMEITASRPGSDLTIALHFLKPFEARNSTEFTLRPQGQTTELTWAMSGDNTFASKVFSVFVSMDKLVGKDFEAGLAALKSVAER